MIARGDPQQLRHAGWRRVVAIRGQVGNPNPHGCRNASTGSRGMTAAPSQQELLRDGGAYAFVLRDEFANELVQAALEDAVHAAVLQPCAYAARLALRWALPSIGPGDRIKVAHDRLVTSGERARHLIAQDQEISNKPGLDALAVDPTKRRERRHRPQDRRPLEIVERAADALIVGQEQVILHVEDTRRVVGALDVDTEAREPVGVVAKHGAVGGAVKTE